MSKAFDTVNVHKLINKIHDTNIPQNIQKFIANYLKGRKAYSNSKSRQGLLKTGVPQGGVLSLTLFYIYTSDFSTPPIQSLHHPFKSKLNHMQMILTLSPHTTKYKKQKIGYNPI